MLAPLNIVVPPSSFMTDVRSAYDGAVGGTLASSFVAIPAVGAIPPTAIWWTQSDGAAQRGLNPGNYEASLAGYSMVQVSLPGPLTDAPTVAAATAAVLTGIGYSVIVIGDQIVIADVGPGAFTGVPFASRGAAGLWGLRLAQPSDFGSYGSGLVSNCNAQYLQAPALAGLRLTAMDVFIDSPHPIGEQFRLAVYLGGGIVDPTGATLLYDFGLTEGTATLSWVRCWVDPNDAVLVPSAANLWNTVKDNGGTIEIGGVFTGSGGEGNFLDQDFWQSSSMSNDPAVPFEPVFSAGGAHGSTFILATRLIFESAPYASDGSWRRRFGTHVPVTDAPNSAPINASLLMSGTPPQALGMELHEVIMPYGAVHLVGSQFRVGAAEGGVAIDTPNGADRIADLGQTTGTAIETYESVLAPPPGPFAIPVDNTEILRWWVKNDDPAGSEIAFANPGAVADISPLDNPMDWPVNGVGTNPEYEIVPPNADTDPAVPFELVVPATTVPPDLRPGNYPFAALGLRVNGLLVFNS